MSGADSYVHAHSDVKQLVKKPLPGARLQEVNGTAAMAYLLAHMPRRDLMLLFGRTLEFTDFLFENVRLALRVWPFSHKCVRAGVHCRTATSTPQEHCLRQDCARPTACASVFVEQRHSDRLV